MMDIQEKKAVLEALLTDDIGRTLEAFKNMLPESSDKRKQLVLLTGQYNDTIKRENNSLLTAEESMVHHARTRRALIDLIGGLQARDFEPGIGPSLPQVSGVPKFMIVYDMLDQPHATLLNKHLNLLKLLKKIRVFNVQEGAGNLSEQAQKELQDTDYILALITVNLFNSPEWFELVFNALGEGRRLIPVLISKTDIDGSGLEKLRSLPSMGRAVSDFHTADEAYADIVTELKKLLPK